jgi:hypothetical protein
MSVEASLGLLLSVLLSLGMASDWTERLPVTVCRYGFILVYDTTDGLMLLQLGPQLSMDSLRIPAFPRVLTCSRVAVRDSSQQTPRS